MTGGNAPTAGLFGTIQVNADGSYVYTLTKPFDTSPDADNGANTEVAESFSYVATDANGNTATGTITVNIIDDVPSAVADINSGIEGGLVTGNVLTDGTDDVFGADGAAATVPAGGVTGVAAGNDTSSPVSGGVGVPVVGSFGTLTLNATGSYSYDGNPNVVPPAGAAEVFVYTITDGDGDTSTVTLTINLTDSGIIAPADSDVTVNENALDTTALPDGADLAVGTVTGSLPGSAAETDATNQLTATSSVPIVSYALVTGGNAPTAGLFGTIQVNADGSYVYTLTKPFDTSPDADNGANTEVAESFSYVATDADGNTATGTITVNIIDDVPSAVADINSGIEGGLVTGNVLTDGTDDVFGADGAAATVPAGGVTGVAAGNDTSSPVSGGVGVPVVGSFGTLTLNATGSYSYDGNPNVVPPAGAADVFVYTITDGDGDTSTVTLTINLTDSGIIAPADSDVTVNENALDTTALPDGADLAVGTVTGSLPGSAAETDATNQLTATSSVPIVSYALVTGGNAPTAGLFGTIQVNADGSYVYTLTKPFDTSPDADNGANTEVAESFSYVATDANGNTATGTITVNIIDDVPSAVADINSGIEGGLVTGNVLTDGTDDVFGADGAAATVPAGGVTGVAAGNDTSSPVSGGVGVPVVGSFGTLTLNATGSYSYDGNPNVVPPAGAADVFVYTITDGDGDTSTVTLTINLTDSSLAASNDDLTVNEAALSTGSNPSSTAETVTGTVVDNVTGGVGPFTYALVGGGTGTHGTLTFNPDGSYSYTLTSTVDGATLDNGITTENNVETFTYQVTDADGNITTSTITIDVIDDVPTAVADIDSVVAGTPGPATGNVLTGGTDAIDSNATDGVADVQGADGAVVVGGVAGNINANLDNPATLAAPIQGAFGKLTLAAGGTYSYTRDPGTAGGVNDVFTYTIKDGDGDLSHTTLTISIGNSSPTITDLTPAAGGGDVTVNEDDLLASRGAGELAGSDASKESLTQTGTFTVSSPDGIKSLTIDGHAVISNGVFTATSFTTSTLGNTLSVTGYDAATGVVSYSYTLLDNETHAAGAGTNSLFENLAVVLTDQDNQTANDTLVANIVDDVPTAVADIDSVVAGTPGPATGNVLTGGTDAIDSNTTDGVADVQGADGAVVVGGAAGNTNADLDNPATLDCADPGRLRQADAGRGRHLQLHARPRHGGRGERRVHLHDQGRRRGSVAYDADDLDRQFVADDHGPDACGGWR